MQSIPFHPLSVQLLAAYQQSGGRGYTKSHKDWVNNRIRDQMNSMDEGIKLWLHSEKK